MISEPRLPIMCPGTHTFGTIHGLPYVSLELCPIGTDEFGLGDPHPAGPGPSGFCDHHLRQLRERDATRPV